MHVDMTSTPVERFREFYQGYQDENGKHIYIEQVQKMSLEGLSSVILNYDDLLRYDPELARLLRENPEETIKAADDALVEVLRVEDPIYASSGEVFHARFISIPDIVDLRRLRSVHLGQFISVEGIIIRQSVVKPLLVQGVFQCAICGEVHYINQEDGMYAEPSRCVNPNCGKKGPFKLLTEESTYTDLQTVTVQEKPEELPPGQIPRSLPSRLVGDLVDSVRAGDRAIASGILKMRPSRTAQGKSKTATFDPWLDVNFISSKDKEYEDIEIDPETEEEIIKLSKDLNIHRRIVRSIAPSIYGMETIKEALASVLFGGVSRVAPDGMKQRGDSNVLLVGDPGVAKCCHGETEILEVNGVTTTIEKIVNKQLAINSTKIDDGYYAEGTLPIFTLNMNGKLEKSVANIFWKREAPKIMFKIKTNLGNEITVTPTHPFFVTENCEIESKKAKLLKVGDFIASPLGVQNESESSIDIDIKKGLTTAQKVNIPKKITPELARLLGYLCGDGCVYEANTSYVTSFTNADKKLIDDYIYCFEQSFKNINFYQENKINSPQTREIRAYSIELGRFFQKLAPSLLEGSDNKRVPNAIMKAPNELSKEFLKGYFDADGTVNKKRATISATSSSGKLLSDIQLLLRRHNIVSQIGYTHSKSQTSKKKKYHRLKITSIVNFKNFKHEIGFSSIKNERLDKNFYSNTNINVVPGLSQFLLELREEYGLSQYEMGITRSTYQHYEKGDRNPSRGKLREIILEISRIKQSIKIEQLQKLIDADIFWTRIVSIKEIIPDFEWVYDLQVPETHNFVANGIFVHNSQMLQYIARLAPRGLLTSGKASSAAGLTAAVVRDPDSGEFTLEAGALVLADRGVCLIDEFDKMNPVDRSAIHEAMEQHTISIAKAGIVATLNARTSIIAAANPRFGRYEDSRPPNENINLPPTILSRFDLIFVIKDIPDEDKDKKMARHILELRRGHITEAVEPVIPMELLRKYISYAKQQVEPALTDEAMERIEAYYLDLRKTSDENTAIAITPRYLEAIIRLSESQARMALKDEVTIDHVEAAINLLRSSLEQVGKDPVTGKVDIDFLLSGTTKATRSKMQTVIDLIKEESRKGTVDIVPVRKIKELAKENNIEEDFVDKVIEQLRSNGEIYSPRDGYVKLA